jgi:hypothetical protein
VLIKDGPQALRGPLGAQQRSASHYTSLDVIYEACSPRCVRSRNLSRRGCKEQQQGKAGRRALVFCSLLQQQSHRHQAQPAAYYAPAARRGMTSHSTTRSLLRARRSQSAPRAASAMRPQSTTRTRTSDSATVRGLLHARGLPRGQGAPTRKRSPRHARRLQPAAERDRRQTLPAVSSGIDIQAARALAVQCPLHTLVTYGLPRGHGAQAGEQPQRARSSQPAAVTQTQAPWVVASRSARAACCIRSILPT